jgi:hypothetical protein
VNEARHAVSRAAVKRALALVVAGSALSGCFDVKSVDPGIEVLPDAHGRVDAAHNELGINGVWYSYGDQYDVPQACTKIGMHDASECSVVSSPAPLPTLDFPNSGGRMCTLGVAAQAVKCNPDPAPLYGCKGSDADYSNIWGAGIGLDFALPLAAPGEPLVRSPLDREVWSADAHGIVGVAFDITWTDSGGKTEPHVRVEFPMLLPSTAQVPDGKGASSLVQGGKVVLPDDADRSFPDATPETGAPSDEHPSGSPFWRAPSEWALERDHVRVGHNEVRFSEVSKPPEDDYAFDRTQLLGIQFHVPTTNTAPLAYGFCISNLTFLRE